MSFTFSFQFLAFSFSYPRAESNCHLKFRKLPFYPLNYKGLYSACKANRKNGLFQIIITLVFFSSRENPIASYYLLYSFEETFIQAKYNYKALKIQIITKKARKHTK